MNESYLKKLQDKLNYYNLEFYEYNSFYDEEYREDADELVKNTIDELLQATKNKEDIFYKEQEKEIQKLKDENKKLKEKINNIQKEINKE